MIENKGVTVSWLEGLAARGITAHLRNGRLWLRPSTAYRSLTDEEIIVLRHHREEIKTLVKDGAAPLARAAEPHAKACPATESAKPAPTCPYCGQAPCIGRQHELFFALHPEAEQQRADEYATKVLKKMTARGAPDPFWWQR